MKQMEAFELWVHPHILRITYTEYITKVEVTRRTKGKEILYSIKEWKIEYLGQGKIDSKRKNHSYLHNLRQWIGLTSVQLFRNVANKIKIAMMIAKVLNRPGT